MKKSVIDKILCSTGYLPPRNEAEMAAFEKEYSHITIRKDFHVDLEQIVNGSCGVKTVARHFASRNMSSSDVRMAARNFESLPKDVIEKIMKQHKSEDD